MWNKLAFLWALVELFNKIADALKKKEPVPPAANDNWQNAVFQPNSLSLPAEPQVNAITYTVPEIPSLSKIEAGPGPTSTNVYREVKTVPVTAEKPKKKEKAKKKPKNLFDPSGMKNAPPKAKKPKGKSKKK
jgi:hypothetical protein